MEIKITKTTAPKEKPPVDSLGFGKFFTDHMFVMDYAEGKGWHNPQIVPYGPLALDPSCATLHYGQSVFEGLKAYKGENGKIMLFRPYDNMNRINESNERLCIPKIDVDFAVEAIKALVELDQDWIPGGKGTALYIRPFIFATDPFLGVHPAATYKFIIILSPVGAYYKEGLNPVKIYVEDEYVRAVRGGMGFSKTAGNYAASLKAQEEAEKKGYTQVLWLDGVERKYIEEVGAMNIFFKIDGKVVTPALNGSILAGITRNSCLKVLNAMGIDAKEAKISIQEVYEAYENGKLEEVFGTGTAAVISPVGELCWAGKKMIINNNEIGPVSQKLYDTITGIQGGKIEDTFGFTVTL